ncbi:reverse transcriptase-like protein [Candidatus Microgenomates bacterium]|jgi:ribonuclease HI|nr:MAG: reverse transcriptase-like protein [Candidatus Microgenomates bacterium]
MKKDYFIKTDGGARGNPGPAAIGIFIKDSEGHELLKKGEKIGETTNNVAEYLAVVKALEWLKENIEKRSLGKIFFDLDSSLVVNQLNGIFKIKEAHLRELVLKIKTLENEVGGNIFYRHIPREENRAADALVNSALDNSI